MRRADTRLLGNAEFAAYQRSRRKREAPPARAEPEVLAPHDQPPAQAALSAAVEAKLSDGARDDHSAIAQAFEDLPLETLRALGVVLRPAGYFLQRALRFRVFRGQINIPESTVLARPALPRY